MISGLPPNAPCISPSLGPALPHPLSSLNPSAVPGPSVQDGRGGRLHSRSCWARARMCLLQAHLSSLRETHSQLGKSAWSLDACTSRGPLRLEPIDRVGPRTRGVVGGGAAVSESWLNPHWQRWAAEACVPSAPGGRVWVSRCPLALPETLSRALWFPRL